MSDPDSGSFSPQQKPRPSVLGGCFTAVFAVFLVLIALALLVPGLCLVGGLRASDLATSFGWLVLGAISLGGLLIFFAIWLMRPRRHE
ncbi:conserved hypothetical protein [Bradyrhizobium sp. STM 3843]|uniref:hypothetical protein n=1 Tax=Bradyrhizobium sp. STM 3843 TaxID=551947 RepID=UPI0002405578|nr:hypothetical protein [Bradyrhizobium sp. STM 3843]CCE09414.1 conserved hypothetical protein [Bradyrhizobium sp. STM 3843]